MAGTDQHQASVHMITYGLDESQPRQMFSIAVADVAKRPTHHAIAGPAFARQFFDAAIWMKTDGEKYTGERDGHLARQRVKGVKNRVDRAEYIGFIFR